MRKGIKYFFNNYTLRWLFYREIENLRMVKHYESKERCSKCKHGGATTLCMCDGSDKYHTVCVNCGSEYIAEPNTNFSYYYHRALKFISKVFWGALDYLHIVRSAVVDSLRYGMCGDENMYVEEWTCNYGKGITTYKLKSRVWWQYIFIVRKHKLNK
jgi:hypothetical protein